MPETRATNVGLQPGQLCAILGVTTAGFALWIFPLVLGPAAMVLGAVAWLRGERRARWIFPLAIVCMVTGVLFGLIPENLY